jgi:hypothetical protein
MLSALLVQPRKPQGYVSDLLLVDQDQSFVAKDSFLLCLSPSGSIIRITTMLAVILHEIR